MKFNFRKISAIASSVLLAGMTVGIAAAANFPSPFVSNGVADYAIVYGANAALSDQTAATSIDTELAKSVTSGSSSSTSVSGGESFMLDKDSDHFNFNEALNAISGYETLTNDELSALGDNAEYKDGDVDDEYDEEIILGSNVLELFADSDYNDKEPTVGFFFDGGSDTILQYEIDFSDGINFTDMIDTDMPFLGNEYYVLDADEDQIDLLDTAERTTATLLDTVTVNSKSVTVDFVDSDSAKLTIDGESTGDLPLNDEYELKDGSYVVVTDTSYQDYAGGIQSVEFSIGSGKISIIADNNVELNDDSVDELTATIDTSGGLLDKITLTWEAYDDTFLTEDNSLTMPLFDMISLSYGGLNYPSDSENIEFANGDQFTIEMDNFDFEAIYFDGSSANLGADGEELIVATSIATNDTWTSPPRTANLTGGLDLTKDDTFIVTKIKPDLSDCDQIYYKVKKIENSSGDITVELQNLIDTSETLTLDEILDTEDPEDITITLVAVNGTGITGTRAYLNFSASDTLTYNKVISDKGLVITIPTDGATTVIDGNGADFLLTEPDYEGDVNEGYTWEITVKNNSNENLHVATYNLTAFAKEESKDHDIGVVPSDLASKFTFDNSADEYDYSVEFFGEEVSADVEVIYGGEVSTTTTDALGNMIFKDTEVSSVSGKNLIVVGGSCINSVAAKLLDDSALCGAAFTAKTGVGAGQYMVKKYSNPYTTGTGKIALLVAGYEAADTSAAAQYVVAGGFDASMADYKGITATVM